jgi:transcriptional regulator with GAF, ATPase, and Fis domain
MRQPGAFALGRSSALVAALLKVAALADTPDPLLILGERGTGKTVLARHIHTLSRSAQPFIEFSTAEVADTLHHAALFGHAKGAYTGAVSDARGVFEQAHTGTLFFDEIGNASLGVQASLLRAVESDQVKRLGDERVRFASPRLIFATNADLEAMVEAGTFLADLYDRIGGFWIRLPPMRERADEIVPLFLSSITVVNQENSARGMRTLAPLLLDHEVHRLLEEAPWPGNLRQVVQQGRYAAYTSRHEGATTIGFRHLSPSLLAEWESHMTGIKLGLARRTAERRLILQALLAQERGSVPAAAARLGVSIRHAFRLLAGHRPVDAQPRRGRSRKVI